MQSVTMCDLHRYFYIFAGHEETEKKKNVSMLKMIENETFSKMLQGGNFTDVFEYIEKPKKLIDDAEIDNGYQAKVSCYSISRKKNRIIKDTIGIDTNRKIIRKQYLDIKECKKERSMQREIDILLPVYCEPHFPTLLSIGKNCIYLSYCGVPITKRNLPKSWKSQLSEILNFLEKKQIWHNDMDENNFLVLNKTLYLIDFGWATKDKESYPFKNINKEDIPNYITLNRLSDVISNRPINRRRRDHWLEKHSEKKINNI